MIHAGLKELELEQFIRNRNSGEIVWQTKEGLVIPIKDMTDEHLANTIKMLRRIDEEYSTQDELDFFLREAGACDLNDIC